MRRHYLAVDVDAEPAELRELVELACHRRHVSAAVSHQGDTLTDLAVSLGREVRARRPSTQRGQGSTRRPG